MCDEGAMIVGDDRDTDLGGHAVLYRPHPESLASISWLLWLTNRMIAQIWRISSAPIPVPVGRTITR
jgi:hypothetical protein